MKLYSDLHTHVMTHMYCGTLLTLHSYTCTCKHILHTIHTVYKDFIKEIGGINENSMLGTAGVYSLAL